MQSALDPQADGESPSADVAQFRRDGFLIVRSVVEPSELVELRTEVDRLHQVLSESPGQWGNTVDWERDHLDDGGPLTNAIARIEPLIDLSPRFAELALDPRVTAAARTVFGEPVALFEDKLNLKLPGGAGFPWHQDWSCCWRASTDQLVTCFISLDDTTSDNGPLQVIPGSHSPRRCLPFREEFGRHDDPAYRRPGFEVDPRYVDSSRAVIPQLRAGDMIVFDSYLLHHSERNRSSQPRRTIIFTYHPASLGRLYEYEALVRERAELVASTRT